MGRRGRDRGLAGHENAKKRKLKQTQKTGENDAWWNWCKAYGRHDTWRNWEHSHNRTHTYAHTDTLYTHSDGGEIDSICVIISAVAGATPRPVKYATLTGFICFYCYCILGRINPRHFGPRSHQHQHQHLPTCHRARAGAGAGAGARASAFCAAVSGSCTSFAALICRSLIYLAIHTYSEVRCRIYDLPAKSAIDGWRALQPVEIASGRMRF